jgi:hypothetical protein
MAAAGLQIRTNVFGLYVSGHQGKRALDGAFFGHKTFAEMQSILRWGIRSRSIKMSLSAQKDSCKPNIQNASMQTS